jgi:hypothetical protein
VDFARAHDLGVAVQATGHGLVRASDGALLILTSGMDQVVIDAPNATAWVGAGATWGAVLDAAQDVGLAPLPGSSPHVGAVGYVLGGGLGWLARRYGLGADAVRYFEVVTADGEIIRCGPDEHPELFWALRGGGSGSLGVVTGMEVKLFPVTKVYAGNIYYPADAAHRVMARYREWIETVPDEMTSSMVLMNFPPVEEIPEQLRGQSFAIIRGCYCGAASDGVELMRFWRDWEPPAIDSFGEMDFCDVAAISSDPVDPLPGYTSTEWLQSLDDIVVAALIDHGLPGAGSTCPLTVTEVRHVGGAVTRSGDTPAAYGNRNETLLLQCIGVTLSQDARERLVRHVDRLRHTLRNHVSSSAYLNFLEGDEKLHRTRSAFTDDSWRRLEELKIAIDPSDLFRFGLDLSRHSVTTGGGEDAGPTENQKLADRSGAGEAHVPKWWLHVAGAIAGFGAAFLLGVVIYQWLFAVSDSVTGWEDLAAVATSVVTFGPIGAIAGAGLAARRALRRRWKTLSQPRRIGARIGVAAVPIGALVTAVATSEPATGLGVGLLALVPSAAAGLGLGGLWERARVWRAAPPQPPAR